jgi:hypothetical protein
MDVNNVLEITDTDGKFYYFTKHNYKNHLDKHPELRIPNFLDRIKKAILEPECVYPSFFKCKDTFCFYYLEFTINNVNRYTKVVVKKKGLKQYVILSAYRPTNIKEVKYFNKPLTSRP